MFLCLKRYLTCFLVFFSLCFNAVESYSQNIFEDTIVPGTKTFYRTDTVYFEELIDGDLKTIRQINVFDTVLTILPIKPKDIVLTYPQYQFKSYPRITAGLNKSWIDSYVGASFGLGFGLSDHSDTITQNISKGYSSIFNSSFGGGFIFHVEEFSLEIGGRITYSQENQSFDRFYTNIDTLLSWDIEEIDTTIIELVSVLIYDELPDTVYELVPRLHDTTFVDSTLITDYDTTRVRELFSQSARFSYIEMPIVLGYDFKVKGFELTVQGGMCFTWLMKPFGYTVDRSYGVRQLKNDYFHKFTLDLLVGLKMNYPISNKHGLYLRPFARYPLIEQYNTDLFVSKKIFRFGFGLGYYFSLY